MSINGPVYIINDIAPSNSIADIFERGQLRKIGDFVSLNNYEPVSDAIPSSSIDLITCYIGLHHIQDNKISDFIKSISRILTRGGLVIIREHDVQTSEMATFVSLAHTVFNLGLNIPWDANEKEYKHFRTADEWSEHMQAAGFEPMGKRLLQDNDPTNNTLMMFIKK